MATTALSGVAFGAGLAAAGVYHPAVITSQLKLENWHMIQAFLAAAASSGIAVLLLDRLGYYHPKPRSASRMGLFGPYDGNILGGALQGLGMALAGACPGTVIPQAAVGVPSGLYALFGTLIGGIAWSGFISSLAARAASRAPAENPKLTVQERLGISSTAIFTIFEAICAGLGMALAGACPGTVIPQAAVGVPSGLYALFGTLIGGIAWSGFISSRAARAESRAPAENPKLTVQERLGISSTAIFTIFEAICAVALYTAGTASAPSRYAAINPALGGLCIGLAQLFSMLVRKTMVGVSTAYEEAGKHFFWLAEGASGPRPGAKNLLFAAGVGAGARLLTSWDPAFKAGVSDITVDPLLAVAGGVCLAVGSRLAGGCTSGHGISGMSMFSTSSFVTIVSMFGAGALFMPLFI
ncbi:hypothetical protein BN1708_001090 [Verticillium longisporum]|uniref:Sulphur transport domain-containing protein n=1 Tax=Verticillium longisporum TaxID=100787 RepID=A0A0G4MGR8_VERLO|nr:hypothetical protein BN1708_001090 [Verticillium longisporum]